MKRNRIKTGIAAVLLLAALGNAGAGNTIGVDISNNLGTYTGAGVLDTSSRAWTLITGNGSFFIGARKISVTRSGGTDGKYDASLDLFDDYKHNGGNTSFTILLQDLDDFRTYNLVVYGAQGALGGRGGSYSLLEPAAAAKATTGDQQSTFEEGVNYVRFDDIVPDNSLSDSRIRLSVTNGIDTDPVGIMNGFELQWTTRNYDWVVNGDVYKGNGATVYGGVGVLDDDGTVWNDLFTSGSNLADSDGTARDVSVSLVDSYTSEAKDRGAASTVNNLTRDFAWDGDGAPSPNGTTIRMTLILSGLRSIESYDLALFGVDKNDTGRGSTFTIDGVSKTTDGNLSGLNSNLFKEGTTHAVFYGIHPAGDGTITVTITKNNADICMLNGFQLGLVHRDPEGTSIIIR